MIISMETITIELPELEDVGYRIRRIQDYEQLLRYADMTDWCVVYSDAALDYYLQGDKRRLYVLERDDWRTIEPKKGKHYPYDSYGFSLLAVIVDADGSIFSITTRWNSIEEDIVLGRDFLDSLLGDDAGKVI